MRVKMRPSAYGIGCLKMRKSALILASSIALISAAYAEQPVPLQELQEQLAIAQDATIKAKAQWDCMQDRRAADLSLVDHIGPWQTACSDIINSINAWYSELAKLAETWRMKYGYRDPIVLALQDIMREAETHRAVELFNVEKDAKSKYEDAVAREKMLHKFVEDFAAQLHTKYEVTLRASIWLQDRIKELRLQVSEADRAVVDFKRNSDSDSLSMSQAQIHLRELEGNAQAYRTLYDNFLQRYMVGVQQQSGQ
jgi:polysaccharide biosynthesis transport protein